MILSSSLLLMVLQGGTPGDFESLVIQDVIPARPGGGGEVSWDTAFGLGDPDGDGLANYFLRSYTLTNSVREHRLYLASGPQPDKAVEIFRGHRGVGAASFNWPFLTWIRTPSGHQFRTFVVHPLVPVFVVSFPSGSVTGPLHPPYRMPFGMFRADDINGDGWDEIFFQSYDNALGVSTTELHDGKTMLELWTVPEGISTPGGWPTEWYGLGGRPDLDGDGKSDFISTFNLGGYRISAYSGTTGTVIWRNLSSSVKVVASTLGPDLDGDTVPDVVLAFNDFRMEAWSGADGSVLWTTPGTVFHPYFPAQGGPFVPSRPLIVQPRVGSPNDLDLLVAYEDFGLNHDQYFVLDARDGSFRHSVELPSDLTPWSTEPFDDNVFSMSLRYSPLGDIDRDGLVEIARRTISPLTDNPATPGMPAHLVILSQATLEAPRQAAAGTVLSAEIGLPSAAGMPYRVLASTSFDADGGALVDGWKTHLAPSQLLTLSQSSPAFTGVLDAAGRATHPIQVPGGPWIGRTIHLKVIVETQAGSGEVFTMSTLSTVEIIP